MGPTPWRSHAIGVVIGVMLGAAVTAVAADRIVSASLTPEIASKASEATVRELPPEWRPHVRKVDLESMYRKTR